MGTPETSTDTPLADRLRAIRPLLAVALIFVAQFHVAPRALNGLGIVLSRHELTAPHHYEASFAKGRHHLASAGPLDLVVTGDSRAGCAVDPDRLSSMKAYTLSCGSQAIVMTEPIILDSLRRCEQKPRWLLIGVTPDYISAVASTDPGTLAYRDYYESAEKLRATSSPLMRIAQRWFPALFYRTLVFDELTALWAVVKTLAPPVEIGGIKIVKPLTWSEYLQVRKGAMTDRGWTAELFGPFVDGTYPVKHGVRGHLKKPYKADREGFARLLASIRAQGIEPLVTVLPFHDSFYKMHGREVREEMERAVTAACRDAGVIEIRIPFDTRDGSSWYDGHHMSIAGATRFSKLLDAELTRIVATRTKS